jgi:hypothetical protein
MGRGFVYGPEGLSAGDAGAGALAPLPETAPAPPEFPSAPPPPPDPSQPVPPPPAPAASAPVPAPPAPAPPAPPVETPDGYKEKLIKYVPAEVLAFFVPLTAFIGSDDEVALIAACAAGVIGTAAYLYQANMNVPKEQQAPPWNYFLAVVAFAAWGLATSPATASLAGLSEKSVAVILALAAFLVPALDFWGAKQAAKKAKEQAGK